MGWFDFERGGTGLGVAFRLALLVLMAIAKVYSQGGCCFRRLIRWVYDLLSYLKRGLLLWLGQDGASCSHNCCLTYVLKVKPRVCSPNFMAIFGHYCLDSIMKFADSIGIVTISRGLLSCYEEVITIRAG